MIKTVLMLCSVIPLIMQTPYLISAWRSSRLDQWDWIYYLLALTAMLWAFSKEKVGKYDYQALFLLLPMIFIALTPAYHKVNALAVAGSVGCIFAAIWAIGSWHLACRILPAAVILLMGTPSSSYAFSLLLMSPVWLAWLAKFMLAMICLVWIWLNKRFDLQIKRGTLFFTAAVLGCSLLLLHSKEIYFAGRSFIPEFSIHISDYWGRAIDPDENTKRFFATSTVKQFRYAKNDIDISVLAVKCGSDIHEIHPASHCLRTSSWTVHAEKILYLLSDLAVTEIEAQKGSHRMLVWVWYSGKEFSTPGFLGFRRHFRSGKEYYTYQISVPIYKSVEQSRIDLRKFVHSLQHLNGNSQKEITQ